MIPYSGYVGWLFMAATVVAQAPVPDWTHMISPYFAFAAAAFLIWSLVQLVNLVYRHSTAATETTISTLREQLHKLEDKMTDRLIVTVEKSTEAMQHNSDALKQINESLTNLAMQMERFGDGLTRMEHEMREHDSRVKESIAKAAGLRKEELGA